MYSATPATRFTRTMNNVTNALSMGDATQRAGKLCFSMSTVAEILDGHVEHVENETAHSMCGMFLRTLAFIVAVVSLVAKWIENLFNGAQKSADGLPKLYYKRSPLLDHLLNNCKSLSQPYQPTFWARNRHLQTLMWKILPHENMLFHRECLEMKDRGIVGLDWVKLSSTTKRVVFAKRPILIIIPEIASDCFDVAQVCWEANQRGYRPVVFNRRGHGDVPLTTARLQSFGDTSDLREAIRYIRRTNKGSQLSAIGLSTGCGLLVSYLGDYGSSTDLEAAACISPMYDHQELIKNPRQPYHWLNLQKYKYFLTKHCQMLGNAIDLDNAFATSSLSQWEKTVYGRMSKLEDEDDYWDENNPLREVDEIAVPLICINSTDDPVSPAEQIPFDLFTTLPNLLLVTTKTGGHCGFYEGFNPKSWALRLSMDYIDSVLKYSSFVTSSVGFNNNNYSKVIA